MTAVEAFRGAISNLAAHKLRSALTMLGMIFGVGAVIAMLSIGAGAERQAMEMIERLGLRNVLVRAKDFKEDEAQEIRKYLDDVGAKYTELETSSLVENVAAVLAAKEKQT